MLKLKQNKKIIITLGILFILSLLSVFALFKPGFFISDDGGWMVIRFSSFYQEFVSGQIPVRFLSRLNSGFGYPVADFLYPGFMYLGIPIHVLGFGFVDTVKIILIFSMIGSAVFMFAWLRRFFTLTSSLFGALVYLYAPYHLYDLYVRGSVGEVLFLAVFPFVLWQYERKSLLFTSLAIGFFILSHNILAFLFMLFFVGYCLVSIFASHGEEKKFWIRFSIITILFGLFLSSFFWVPALFDLQYTVFFKTKISDYGHYFAGWNLVGFSGLFFIPIFWFISKKKISLTKHRLTFYIFIVGILTLFLSFPVSSFLWKILPVSFIQFPFRLLSLTVLCMAFLGAYFLSEIPRKYTIGVFCIGFVFILISAFPYLFPQPVFNNEGFYSTNMDSTTVKNEYMPIWVQSIPSNKINELVVSEAGTVSAVFQKGSRIQFNFNSPKDDVVTIRKVYFPGWNVRIDEKPIKIEHKNGFINFPISKGVHTINAWFWETPVRLVADIISIVSFAGLFMASYVWRKKYDRIS